ncbi:MAG: maleylpyruvate isomerase N-terminal domain-containing protein [Marmoricola sp.]
MTSPTQSYLDNADRFTAVVDAAIDWTAQSPCTDWNAAQVVDHVVSTQRDYLDKQAAGLGNLDESDPNVKWHAHLDSVRDALSDQTFAAKEFDGFFGRTTVAEQLASFYGFDMVVHRWDLGTAVGEAVTFTGDELDRMETAMDGLGDMLYSEGVCAPAIEVPGDASRQQRVLGRLGRRA